MGPQLPQLATQTPVVAKTPIAQAPQAPLPETPGVNPALIKQVLPSTNTMETGLTPTEQALLSNEEKAIKLRDRGMA